MSRRDAEEFKRSALKFPTLNLVVAEGIYDRKIEFIRAGNTYYTRKAELPGLFDGAQRLGVRLVIARSRSGRMRVFLE
jgi:hypothetical protein